MREGMRRHASLVLIALGLLAVWGVVVKARTDSADPARCVGLVPMGSRCCAPGQRVHGSACIGRPSACPAPLVIADGGCIAARSRVLIPGGALHAGAGDWEAEGRIPPHDALIASFELDATEVDEVGYDQCAKAGRCPPAALSGEPGRAVAGIDRAAADAVCRFRGGRLPTDDEWTWAAGGAQSRRYPWGDTGAVCRRAAWGLRQGPCGFGGDGPELCGAHPDGASPEGVFDLAGNVAEWVNGGVDDPGRVRGGSWASDLATELRTWLTRAVAPSTRSREIGVRCAYTPGAAAVVTSTIP